MNSCPSRDRFEKLLAGQLAASVSEPLVRHVELCPACRDLLAELTDDPSLEKWRELLRRERTASSDAALNPILEDIRARPPDGLPEPPPPGDTPAICFPGPRTPDAPLGHLGAYGIRRELKAGAFGFVYEAHHATLGRTVAIKVLRPELAASPGQRARFEREMQAAATVKHDNVITIHEVGNTPEFPLPYFVMEYVAGESLSERLAREEAVPFREAARIVREAALGLSAAHAQGIIHRDVKPTNILLEQDTCRVRITDFGLARLTEGAWEKLSLSGRILGTPAYMSPEQIASPGDIDHRTDVYSLGVVLYELLTGDRPFRGAPHVVLEHVVHDDPRPPHRLNDRVPRDLETICLKAMEKDPARRYASAAEFAEDARRFIAGEPIRARPVSIGERSVKWARRRPAVIALLTALILVTAAAFAGITWKWREAARDRDQARWENERANRNFAWARKAAEETMTKLLSYPQFRMPPYTDLQEELMKSAVAFYEDVAEQSGGDRRLDADRGQAYWRLAFLRASRGQHAQALAEYRKMEAVFTRLAADVPEQPEYRDGIAWSLCGQGNMLRDLKRYSEAELVYGRASTLCEELTAQHPDRTDFAVRRGATYANRGILERRAGRFREALDWHGRSLAILEPLKVEGFELVGDRRRFLTEGYQDRGLVLLRLERPKEAATDFARLVDLHPDDPHRWYDSAIAHLGADDIKAYGTVCSRMLDRFGKTDDARIAERILYTCLPVADAVPDTTRLIPLAERAATLGKHNQRLLGAAFHRAGRYQDAVRCLEEAVKVLPPRGWDWCFLAIACQRVGEKDKGFRYREQARKWIEEMVRADPHGEGKRWGWTERVETKQLRTEMELTSQR
jgi:tetratricopeptide (TPR) repeat protein